MKSLNLPVTALLALGFAAHALAAPPKNIKPRIPQSLVEASADGVLLPSSDNGILVIRCAGCTPRSFRVTVRTSYSLDGQSTTLAELRRTLAAQPQTNLNLAIEPKTAELLSIDAMAQSGAAAPGSRAGKAQKTQKTQPVRKPGAQRISK
jgi:hypothetical protein